MLLNNIKTSKYLPFVFMGIVMLFFYITATDKFSDDVLYAIKNPLQDGLINMTIDSYLNWSSRMIIRPTMVALMLLPIWLWRILDLAIWIMLAMSISKLFIKEENVGTNWFLVAFMMLYPYWHMATAGWIATTTNFFWPLSFGMFALFTLKRIYEGVLLPVYRWMFFGVAILYASDAEQKVMILLAIFAVLAIYQVHTKSPTPMQYRITLFGSLVFLIARMIFTLTTPGNHVRRLTGHYTVSRFEDYSLWQRLVLGFELASVHYTQFTIALFPFFALLLLTVVWKLHNNIIKRVIAAVPLAISVSLSSIMVINALFFARDNLAYYEGWFLDSFILMALPSWPGSNILFILFYASLMYAVYLSCQNAVDRSRVVGIMLLGFLSQLMLGFSPSLYGSALRTFVYASFAIIISALYLYENGAKEYLGKFMKILLVFACVVNFALTFAISFVRMTV